MDNSPQPSREYIAHLEHLFKERHEKEESAEAKKFNQMLSEFISIVSHEMRTPLSVGIDGLSLVLEGMAGKLNTKQKEYLKISQRGLERLKRIVESMLDLTRIEEGKFNLQKKVISANSLTEELLDYYKLRAKEEEKLFSCKSPSDSPLIHADHDRLMQVLMNFIDNAFKFTSSGAKIEVSIIDKENKIEFSVSDTGVGIPKEALGKVFDRFHQLGNKDVSKPGLGLGLAIAREIIHAHGGKIWAESVVKLGSRFVFSLPKLLPFFPDLEKLLQSKIPDKKIIADIKGYGIIKTVVCVLENSSLEIDFKENLLEKFSQFGLIKGIVPTIYDHINDFTRLHLTSEGKNLEAQSFTEAFLMAYIEKNMGEFEYQGKPIYEFGDINKKRVALMSLVKEMDAKAIEDTLKKLEVN